MFLTMSLRLTRTRLPTLTLSCCR